MIFPVDLLSLNVAIEAFDAHGLRGQNERMLDVGDLVTILGSLYETVSVNYISLQQRSFNLINTMWEERSPPQSAVNLY